MSTGRARRHPDPADQGSVQAAGEPGPETPADAIVPATDGAGAADTPDETAPVADTPDEPAPDTNPPAEAAPTVDAPQETSLTVHAPSETGGGPPADRAPEPAESPPPSAARFAPPGSASARTNARLAHVHLAVGMYGLARAELETLAAAGSLDVRALADLAEVRWRTGDMVGAGEAADAHLQAGGEELVALCVAAEAAGASGRPADARNLAARVLARGRDRLDDLFAGQPRGAIWPPGAGTAAPSAEPDAAGDERQADVGPRRATPSMSGDLAEIQGRLAGEELAGIATRLALVLRTRPVLAPAVLAVADEALRAAPTEQEIAALHLVRGDAYRLMGRESLAAEAFQQSGRALRTRPPEETP